MPRKSKTKKQAGEESTRCSWSNAENAILVKVLTEQKLLGNQADSGWKAVVWKAVADALESSGIAYGPKKTPSKCQDHWTNFKANYAVVKELRHKSGFGWNDELKLVTATDEVWAPLLQENPTYSRWQKESFPLYDECAFLVDGATATGQAAFRAGQEPNLNNDDQNKKDKSDEHEGSQCASSNRKRSPSPVQERTPKRRRVSKSASARALSEMSDAIRSMVDFVREPEPASQMSSPARQRAILREAIEQLEEDNDLSDEEQVSAIELFMSRPVVADSYIAIGRKTLRTRFMQRQLQNTRYHDNM